MNKIQAFALVVIAVIAFLLLAEFINPETDVFRTLFG